MEKLRFSAKSLLASSAFALAAAYSPTSLADQVTISFEASNTFKGLSLVGSLSYDTSLVPTNPESTLFWAYSNPGALELSVFDSDGNLLSQVHPLVPGQPSLLRVIFNLSGADSFQSSHDGLTGDAFMLAPDSESPAEPVTPSSFSFSLNDVSRTWLPSGDLPTSLGSAPLLSSFQIWFTGETFGTGIPFQATSLSMTATETPATVPLPGTLALMAAGLLVAGATIRKRTASPKLALG